MHKKLLLALIVSLSIQIQQHAIAQESMLPGISYVYVEKLINVTKENYPRIKNFQSQVNVAKFKVTKAQFSWFDGLTFSYVYQPNNTLNIVNPNFFNGYQIGVLFNLGGFIQKPFNVKQTKEELKIAGYEKDEYELTITSEVKKRYFTYLQYLSTLKLRARSVEDATSILELIKHKFEKGEETFENYNKALLSVTQQNEAKIQNEANLLIAKSDLEELLGQKLETIQ